MRLIWVSSCLAILDAVLEGEECLRALAEAWTRYGPPDAISIATPCGPARVACYRRAASPPPPVRRVGPERDTLVVQLVFRSRSLGQLYWLSDDNPHDLACLLEECGLPQAVLLTRRSKRQDWIQRSRRRPSPLIRLLALEAGEVLTI